MFSSWLTCKMKRTHKLQVKFVRGKNEIEESTLHETSLFLTAPKIKIRKMQLQILLPSW